MTWSCTSLHKEKIFAPLCTMFKGCTRCCSVIAINCAARIGWLTATRKVSEQSLTIAHHTNEHHSNDQTEPRPSLHTVSAGAKFRENTRLPLGFPSPVCVGVPSGVTCFACLNATSDDLFFSCATTDRKCCAHRISDSTPDDKHSYSHTCYKRRAAENPNTETAVLLRFSHHNKSGEKTAGNFVGGSHGERSGSSQENDSKLTGHCQILSTAMAQGVGGTVRYRWQERQLQQLRKTSRPEPGRGKFIQRRAFWCLSVLPGQIPAPSHVHRCHAHTDSD